MNSFNTDTDTSNIVRKYDSMTIDSFNQNKYPRIYADSLLPMITDHEGQHHEWYSFYPFILLSLLHCSLFNFEGTHQDMVMYIKRLLTLVSLIDI